MFSRAFLTFLLTLSIYGQDLGGPCSNTVNESLPLNDTEVFRDISSYFMKSFPTKNRNFSTMLETADKIKSLRNGDEYCRSATGYTPMNTYGVVLEYNLGLTSVPSTASFGVDIFSFDIPIPVFELSDQNGARGYNDQGLYYEYRQIEVNEKIYTVKYQIELDSDAQNVYSIDINLKEGKLTIEEFESKEGYAELSCRLAWS